MIIDIANVAARTTIVKHTQGRLNPMRKHAGETRAENARHNVRDIAQVRIKIMDNATLNAIASNQQQAYLRHTQLTLPTIEKGMRLLPGKRQLQHSEEMRKFGDEHERLVAQFLTEYDDEKASAPARLNGLYDATMWPHRDLVATKFKFQTRYLPTPTDGQWGEWLTDSVEAAEYEIEDRLRKALEHVRDRCKSDGRLFKSVFDSIRELADLVPDLDFTGQYAPVVAAMEPLTKVHSEFIADDENLRGVVAAKADSILSVLGGIK